MVRIRPYTNVGAALRNCQGDIDSSSVDSSSGVTIPKDQFMFLNVRICIIDNSQKLEKSPSTVDWHVPRMEYYSNMQCG